MIKAILHVDDLSVNVLSYEFGFKKITDEKYQPYPGAQFKGLVVKVEGTANNIWWEHAIADHMPIPKVTIELQPAVLGQQKTTYHHFYDCHITSYKSKFSSGTKQPYYEMFLITSQGFESTASVAVYQTKLRKTFDRNVTPLTRESYTPEITEISWENHSTKETDIGSINYTDKASLIARINNPQGNTAKISITKKDGSAFTEGQYQLEFTEAIANDGSITLTPLEIKEEWEAFKTTDIDELVAKIEHGGTSKKSKLLQVIPQPKATLHFRPHSGWNGEFGFDWLREEDTSIDGDVDYETIVGAYGPLYATNPNAVFTPKDYPALENEYNPTNINNRKDASGNPISYYTPWLSIYRAPNTATPPYAELELLTEVDVKPDELYIEFPKKYFNIAGAVNAPNDTTLKHYKLAPAMQTVTASGNFNKSNIKLECLHTLDTDQTLNVWVAKKKPDGSLDTPILSGMLKVRANSKKDRRVSNIVFVNVKTKINRSLKEGINAANKTTQENYLSPFLKQALVKAQVENEDLELYDPALPDTQTLNTDYTLLEPVSGNNIFNKYSNSGGQSLVNFLAQQFNAKPAFAKYSKHYKVFFLGEAGGRMSNGRIKGLGGHANGINSKECVMYSNPMPFFVAHELMHCMGLHHSFDNNSLHTFKIGQTENIMDYSHVPTYATPNGTLTQISTWKWQWDILKNSNEKET